MKLIIDISDEYYASIKHDVENHLTDYKPFEIIGKGIPLYDPGVNTVVIEKYSNSTYKTLLMKVLKKVNTRLDNLHIETLPISPEQETKFLYYNMGIDDCLKVLNNTWESVTK